MSLDANIYLGPYLECTPEQIDCVSKIRTCSNLDCSNYKVSDFNDNIKFCCQCGRPVEDREIPAKKDNVDKGKLEDKLGGMFRRISLNIDKKYTLRDFWILNYRDFNDRPVSFAYYRRDLSIEIDDNLILSDMKLFGEKFKRQISQVMDAYSSDKVEIKWGVLYFSR